MKLRLVALVTVLGIAVFVAIFIHSLNQTPPVYEGVIGTARVTIPSTQAPFSPTLRPDGGGRLASISFLFAVPRLDDDAQRRTKNFKPQSFKSQPNELIALARETGLSTPTFYIATRANVNEGERRAGCQLIKLSEREYGLDASRVTCPPQKTGAFRSAKTIFELSEPDGQAPFVIVCAGQTELNGQDILRVCALTVVEDDLKIWVETTFAYDELKNWREIKLALVTTLKTLVIK